MRNIFATLFLLLFLCGCATTSKYREENKAKIDAYFKQPDNNVMIVIDALQETILSPTIQCHQNIGMLADMGSHSGSFEASTPFVMVLPTGKTIAETKNEYMKLSESDKGKALIQLRMLNPTFSITCQSQNACGIEGKIYFNGKVVSSDTANISYGVVNLAYTLSLEELVK